MDFKKIFCSRKGNSTPMTVALILGLLLAVCTISEFFRLMIIVQGVRDGLQQAVTSVAVSNYDDAYNGLREGYSGGYRLSGDRWEEELDYDDVYGRLDLLLGLQEEGSCHVKSSGDHDEYRLSGLDLKITNTPLTPGDASRNLEADAAVMIEIPLSFGWEGLPPFQMEIRTKAVYMPKF